MSWQKSAAVFDERAAEYDSWYDDSLLFAIELAAIKELRTPLAAPRLEIGVGPGRFARELDVELGLDPAHGPLRLAAGRIPHVCQGVGEELPLADNSFSSIYLLFTLCFTQEPRKVIAEAHRVLRPGGHLVLGVIPADGPWGLHLQAKKEAGHPFYKGANFFEMGQLVRLLVAQGFEAREMRSTLFQAPDQVAELEDSRQGLVEECGLALIVVKKVA
ncbi:MAG: class I SAM-dependent methyltransferase [Thermodesulfobacteriota bacterium]